MPARLGSHNARRVTVLPNRDRGRVVRIEATDTCPDCGRSARITEQGMRRRHRLRNGDDCPGGGVRVKPATFTLDLDNLPPIHVRKSAKPLEPLKERPEPLHREPPLACPDCGNRVAGRRRNDGTARRHRVEPDNPFAPWCVHEEDK